MICPRCEGEGQLLVEPTDYIECPRCNGTGIDKLCIYIWRYMDTPMEFFYRCGGDEDWVAYVPNQLQSQKPIEWEEGNHCELGWVHVFPNHSGTVYVFTHS